jgi:hypothetical protein
MLAAAYDSGNMERYKAIIAGRIAKLMASIESLKTTRRM